MPAYGSLVNSRTDNEPTQNHRSLPILLRPELHLRAIRRQLSIPMLKTRLAPFGMRESLEEELKIWTPKAHALSTSRTSSGVTL
jgi:hypothetical protein